MAFKTHTETKRREWRSVKEQAMTEKPDIQYAAAMLLAEQGEKAPEYAAQRISELTVAGNAVGAATWAEVLAAVSAIRTRRGWWRDAPA
jgi:predicted cobalt transporter CbtA